MIGRLYGYARVSVPTQTTWRSWPGAGRLRVGLRGHWQREILEPAPVESPEGRLQPMDRVNVAGLTGWASR